jgi:glycosyltransferase involved in cell wall biosynthesis
MPPTAICAPGDPRPAYARSELFVLPTLEDGSPFAVAEAMASGLPVIVTSDCGAAEWVRPETGWVVAPRDVPALRRALQDALARREALQEMGRLAREDTEARAGEHCYRALAEFVTAEAQRTSFDTEQAE